jgi:NAD(P)H-hydrate epimerase
MAKAGSGDVLTGLITGLLAQGYSSEDACKIGVWVHGLAGNFAARKKNEITMTAMDLIDCFTDIFYLTN